MNIKTVTTADGVNEICFSQDGTRYIGSNYYWLKNIGISDVYVSVDSGIEADGDNTALLAAGETIMLASANRTIYVLGEGKVEIHEGSKSTCPFKSAPSEGGSSGFSGDYDDLTDKPKINGVVLSGAKSLSDFGIMGASETAGSLNLLPQSHITNLFTVNQGMIEMTHELQENVGTISGYAHKYSVASNMAGAINYSGDAIDLGLDENESNPVCSLSFKIKGDLNYAMIQGVAINMFGSTVNVQNLSREWREYSVAVPYQQLINPTAPHFMAQFMATGEASFYIADIKIGIGTISTSWAPSASELIGGSSALSLVETVEIEPNGGVYQVNGAAESAIGVELWLIHGNSGPALNAVHLVSFSAVGVNDMVLMSDCDIPDGSYSAPEFFDIVIESTMPGYATIANNSTDESAVVTFRRYKFNI